MSKRLTGAELLDEVQWLLEGDVHPLMICQVLGKNGHAIEATARRYGRVEVRRVFATVSKQERERKQRRAA